MTQHSENAGNSLEEKIFLAAEPKIRKTCSGRWLNMEPEDRVAEASFFFIRALRSLPHSTGHFMSDYIDLLIPYMDKKNREYPSHYRKIFSLDAPLPSSNDSGEWNRYDTNVAPCTDESVEDVKLFLQSLPDWQQMIMHDILYNGLSKSKTAKKHGITLYALTKILLQIGCNYQAEK